MVELENDFGRFRRLLGERLCEPAPGRIQLLTGLRSVSWEKFLISGAPTD